MTTTTTSSQSALLSSTISSAKTAAKTNTSASTTTADSSTSTASALASLANNYTTFLSLLTTQLQNQDPSNPMSSDTFTSELAQFAGVEQQVATNTNLKTLISLTESGQQSGNLNLVGKTASASTSQLPLQNGSAGLTFNTSSSELVAIAVTDSSGNVVAADEFTSSVGSNTWSWDGKDANNNQLSDGSYNVAVQTIDSSGNTSAIDFAVVGTVTGVSRNGDSLYVDMGDTQVDMSDVNSFSSSASSSTSTSTSSGSSS